MVVIFSRVVVVSKLLPSTCCYSWLSVARLHVTKRNIVLLLVPSCCAPSFYKQTGYPAQLSTIYSNTPVDLSWPSAGGSIIPTFLAALLSLSYLYLVQFQLFLASFQSNYLVTSPRCRLAFPLSCVRIHYFLASISPWPLSALAVLCNLNPPQFPICMLFSPVCLVIPVSHLFPRTSLLPLSLLPL